jgi:hypothetical protein
MTIPTGPISRHWAAIQRLHSQYDHDEIGLRLWDQLLYEVVRGSDAFPAYGDLAPNAKVMTAGQNAVFQGRLVNRVAAGPLAVAVYVTNPQGEVVFRREETVSVAAGQQRDYEKPTAGEQRLGVRLVSRLPDSQRCPGSEATATGHGIPLGHGAGDVERGGR